MKPRPRPIRFGTSGWRGIFGEEITIARAAAVATAVSRWLAETGAKGPVLLARDVRAGGAALVEAASEALVRTGTSVDRADAPLPTPAATRAVARGHYAAALVFTASHNPPAYQGLKVFGAEGAGLEPRATRRLERLALEALAGPDRSASRRRGRVRRIDPLAAYLDALSGVIDREAMARRRPTLHYDALHGAGAGVLDRVLAEAGARVVPERCGRDARFAGGSPDPVPERLGGLMRRVRKTRGLVLGLATDGDADRFAAVDASGHLLTATQGLALLVDHLAETGRVTRGVALSVATGSLVERVARAHGLRVVRHPIGFKWLSRSLLAGDCDCAGEESGGFAWGRHGVDKDGALAGALLADLLARSGEPLGRRIERLERRFGASRCGRVATPASDRADRALARLVRTPPARVLGERVTDVDRRDGLRLGLADGFVMLRRSGTEPLVRIYAEGRSAAALGARLAEGARWLGGEPSGNFAEG